MSNFKPDSLGISEQMSQYVNKKNLRRLAMVGMMVGLGVTAAEAQDAEPTPNPDQRYTAEMVGSPRLRTSPSTGAGSEIVRNLSIPVHSQLEISYDVIANGYQWARIWSYTVPGETTPVVLSENQFVYVAIGTVNDQGQLDRREIYVDDIAELEPEVIAAPEAPTDSPDEVETNVPPTEAPVASGDFAVPTEATPALINFVDLRTPEAIRENPDWSVDVQSLSYVTSENDTTYHFRNNMGNTHEEDIEFGSRFRESDGGAIEALDENGDIVFRFSVETSELDPNIQSVAFNPNLSELYGMSEGDFALGIRDVLYSHFPWLEEQRINDVRVVYRTGITYTNAGNIAGESGDPERGTIFENFNTFSLDVNATGHTLVIYVGADSSLDANSGASTLAFMPIGALSYALTEREAQSNGEEPNFLNGDFIADIYTIGGNDQFSNVGDNLDNIFSISFVQ